MHELLNKLPSEELLGLVAILGAFACGLVLGPLGIALGFYHQAQETRRAETLAALPGRGIKKIAILAPAFSVDCIETLEEIAMQGQEIFLHAGGERFAYIPCLNDSHPWIDALASLTARNLLGWITPPAGSQPHSPQAVSTGMGA